MKKSSGLHSQGTYAHEATSQRRHLEYIADGISNLSVTPRIILPDVESYSLLNLLIDSKAVGKSGFEISGALKSGDLDVFVNERLLH